MKSRRHIWLAAIVTAAAVGGVALLMAARAGGDVGHAEVGELRNLEGNPIPQVDPVTLRLAVVDAAYGARGPLWEADGWQAYLAGRALGRALALADPDVAVVFDVRLDHPAGEIPVYLRAAVEAELPWWGGITTTHRATPAWFARLGVASAAPLLAGNVVLAGAPVTLVASDLHRGAAGAQAGNAVASARASALSVGVDAGPGTRLSVVVLDAPDAPPPAQGEAFVVRRGGTGGLRSDDGRIGIDVPAAWSVTQSFPSLHWEQAGATGLLVDLARTR